MKLTLLSFLFLFLVTISFAHATMNDTKVVICNDINITEPNCTVWWNTLNLTEANFTYTNTTLNTTYINNITLIYDDNRNQTINLTTVNTNHSTIENKTYVTYNYTGNITDLNLTKDLIPSSAIDTKISLALGGYALKTELPPINSTNSTAVEELKDNLVVWKWSVSISILLILLILGAIVARGVA